MAQRKRTSIGESLGAVAGSTRSTSPQISEKTVLPVEAKQTGSSNLKTNSQPNRVGTKPITVHFPESVRAQLKVLSAEQRRPVWSLVGEALNDLFRKYDKSPIAPESTGK
ncbi:MAG: hypothetical protein GY743_09915 [Planctomycetaceae bacterium]|nr:hypothetical protein [Planctomycetaceae bacterium]